MNVRASSGVQSMVNVTFIVVSFSSIFVIYV
jgi:hypothetical protein